jgi:hypothetical protein
MWLLYNASHDAQDNRIHALSRVYQSSGLVPGSSRQGFGGRSCTRPLQNIST